MRIRSWQLFLDRRHQVAELGGFLEVTADTVLLCQPGALRVRLRSEHDNGNVLEPLAPSHPSEDVEAAAIR